MTRRIGYCTNVHAGADLLQTRANLERFAVPIARSVGGGEPVGIGLWFSARSARELLAQERLAEWRDWLGSVHLVPYTFNGFPYGDFHSEVVKHAVYQPTWLEEARIRYTEDLVGILDYLLPPGEPGSISTLPLAWSEPAWSTDSYRQAAANLQAIAHQLHRLYEQNGRLMTLCLEPEPGCLLQRTADLIRFFEDYLLPGQDEAVLRRHLCICHDVCHAAVMFEEQIEVLEQYHRAGLSVGKVQVSSAVRANFGALDHAERHAAYAQLRNFSEPRYLHQTMVRQAAEEPRFYEDLPRALASEAVGGEWRVHFHVPIYLRKFGMLEAMQDPILECLQQLRAGPASTQFEVETYAWDVLPEELQVPDLTDGIVRELDWLRQALAASG